MISGNFITSLKKGRDARRKGDLEQVQRAVEMYYEDKKTYPATITFGGKLCETTSCPATDKVYMQKLPNDPTSGKNYEYDYDAVTGSYKLYACLENNQQILPYSSALTPPGGLACSTNCFAQDGTTSIKCFWGISSPNTTP